MDVTYLDSFEWDAAKAETNVRKHGVSFEAAASAFADPFGLVMGDPDHSADEDRFVLLGLSAAASLLVVCHCFREGARIRIVSARRATRRENDQYWEARR